MFDFIKLIRLLVNKYFPQIFKYLFLMGGKYCLSFSGLSLQIFVADKYCCSKIQKPQRILYDVADCLMYTNIDIQIWSLQNAPKSVEFCVIRVCTKNEFPAIVLTLTFSRIL